MGKLLDYCRCNCVNTGTVHVPYMKAFPHCQLNKWSQMEKIVRVNWGRGQFSDVCRSDIVDPSPIRQGQKVRVRWGRNNKEYPATVELCPLPQDHRELSQISGPHVHCTVMHLSI